MYDINKFAVLCHLDMTRCRFQFTSDHIHMFQFSRLMIQTIHIHMIHSDIRNHQIMIVPCHLDTVDMRTKITLCNASHTFMINFLRDLTDTTVLAQSEHCDLSVMIACHKQEPVLIICRKITASHTVDRRMIDTGQFPILLDHISFHAKICNRIQIFFIM